MILSEDDTLSLPGTLVSSFAAKLAQHTRCNLAPDHCSTVTEAAAESGRSSDD